MDPSAEIGGFLDFLYGEQEGWAYLCVGHEPHMLDGKLRHERFVPVTFKWPGSRQAMLDAAVKEREACDVYCGVNLFGKEGGGVPRRTGENALPTDLLWADDVEGAEGDPRFTVVDSGGGKPDSRHAYMRLGEPVEAARAAALSRAVFGDHGAAEGFDAARVLRPVGTLCHKTEPPAPVNWLTMSSAVVPLADLPKVEVEAGAPAVEAVEPSELDPATLPPAVRMMMLNEEPQQGWRSEQMFDFLRLCRNAGLSDADAVAAALLHRPTRAHAADNYPHSVGRQDEWIVKEARRVLEQKLDAVAEPLPLPSIVIRPVADFSAEHEEGAAPLLGEKGDIVLPAGGESMVYGLPGTNKTALTDDLAFHIAGGQESWLGIPIPERRRVLLVENEGPRALRRERLQERLSGCLLHKPGDYLQVWEQPWAAIRLPDDRWRKTLAEQIAALGIELVVIGPVRSLGMTGNGTLPEIEEFVEHFQDVRAQAGTDVGFLVVHHENRGGTVSGVWEGAVESLFQTQGRGHGKVRLFFQKCRWSSEYHQTGKDLVWSSSTPYSFDVIDKPAPTTEAEMASLILDAVGNAPGTSWTPVKNGLPGTQAQRDDARDALLAEGRIVNLVKGENGTQVVLRSVQQGRAASLYLPDHPDVRDDVEWGW